MDKPIGINYLEQIWKKIGKKIPETPEVPPRVNPEGGTQTAGKFISKDESGFASSRENDIPEMDINKHGPNETDSKTVKLKPPWKAPDFPSEWEYRVPVYINATTIKPIKGTISVRDRSNYDNLISTIEIDLNVCYQVGDTLFKTLKHAIDIDKVPIDHTFQDYNTQEFNSILYFTCLMTEFYYTLYHEFAHYEIYNFGMNYFHIKGNLSYGETRKVWGKYQYNQTNQTNADLEEALADAIAYSLLSQKRHWHELESFLEVIFPKIRFRNTTYSESKEWQIMQVCKELALWSKFYSPRDDPYRFFPNFIEVLFDRPRRKFRTIYQKEKPSFKIHPRAIFV